MSHLHPAYIFVGSQQTTAAHAEQFIKTHLCAQSGCNACTSCSQVKLRQHYLLRWLVPENTHTISTLETISETIQFQLNPDEHFFFVLERAELLNLTSGNSLLKSIEEPPPGYHFVLLTSQLDALLPTIVSRCIVRHLGTTGDPASHNLVRHFTESPVLLHEFIKELDRAKIAERDIISFLDQIQDKFSKKIASACADNNSRLLSETTQKLDILDAAREKLPMPGSSKIFLRNLFLQLQSI